MWVCRHGEAAVIITASSREREPAFFPEHGRLGMFNHATIGAALGDGPWSQFTFTGQRGCHKRTQTAPKTAGRVKYRRHARRPRPGVPGEVVGKDVRKREVHAIGTAKECGDGFHTQKVTGSPRNDAVKTPCVDVRADAHGRCGEWLLCLVTSRKWAALERFRPCRPAGCNGIRGH